MAIIINIDVMLVKRKMGVTELSERVLEGNLPSEVRIKIENILNS